MNNRFKTLLLTLSLTLCACTDSSQSNNKPVSTIDNNYLTRPVQEDIFYFILPDRFYNGDTSNDNGSTTIAISQGGFNPKDKGSFHGGDIQGIEQKLDYIQNMGVTAIWLTPVLRNVATQHGVSGYHGYWILDFTQIDPHLGSNDDLKRLIDNAHQRGIKVFFDIITNHTADTINYQQCHGKNAIKEYIEQGKCPYKSRKQVAAGDTYTPYIRQGFENAKVPAWLNDLSNYHNQGESTFYMENMIFGDFFGLDDIKTEKPAVRTGMTQIFKDLVSQFKPDGFRVDAVKHVDYTFWQYFIPAVTEHAKAIGIPNFFIFGEVYSKESRILSDFTTRGKFQSVIDFGFQDAINESIILNHGHSILAQLYANDIKFKDKDSSANTLVVFTGNHDMGRIGHFLSKPELNYTEEQKLKRIKLAHALMFFGRGIPVIYYGDEQGFTGDGGDSLARQNMMPSKVAEYIDDDAIGTDKTPADDNFDSNHVLYQSFKTYAKLFATHKLFREGQHNTIFADEKPGIYAFSRTQGEQTIYGIINTADEEKSVKLSGKLELIYQSGQSKIASGTVTVSGLDFALYRKI